MPRTPCIIALIAVAGPLTIAAAPGTAQDHLTPPDRDLRIASVDREGHESVVQFPTPGR